MIAIMLYAVLSFRHIVFAWDIWDTVEMYRDVRDGQAGWSVFWSLHYEHRIVFPRLLILLDYFFASASGNLLLTLLFVLHAAHAGLLVWVYARSGSADRLHVLLYACIVAMAFVWLKQRENFIWPFQIAWILNAFFASLAVYLAATRPTARGLLASAAACVVAGLSLASGILLPFVIGLMLWRSGVSQRRLLLWGAFAVALATAYMIGYVAPEPKIVGLPHPSPLELFAFAGAYLGNVITMAQFPIGFSVCLGFAGLMLFGWYGIRFLRSSEPPLYARFAFAVSTYVVAMVFVTSWGRASFGLQAAASNRYVTTSVIFWVVLFAWFAAAATPRVRRIYFGTALAVCLGYLVPTQVLLVGKMRDKFVAYDNGALALIAGVEDSAALYELTPTIDSMWRRGGILKEDGLSVYRDAWAQVVGGTVSREMLHFRSDSMLEAKLFDVRRIDRASRSGYFVSGRLEGALDDGYPEVLLLTRGDSVIGAVKTAHRGCDGCFSGYASGERPSFEIVAWPRNGDDDARRVTRH